MSRVRLGRFVNLMTQIQPDPLLKKKFPNPPTPKNQSNLVGWVESSWFWRVRGHTPS